LSMLKAEEQLSVFLENRPGVVADLCAALIDRQINIRALTVLDTRDIGTFRMVVDEPAQAKEQLKLLGAAFTSVPVLSVEIPNRPGAFAHIARRMADAGVNIDYVYATALPGQDSTLGIFRVSDLDRALTLDFNGQGTAAG